MNIKVLGTGCAKCEQTVAIIKDVLKEVGKEASVEKVTDIMQITGYGVLGTPAVVIDEKVISVGKVPSKDAVKEWLK